MIQYRESKISAHHNYLVNNILTPGFVAGKPESESGFYFLADVVLPGESTPRISSRMMDENGELLLELDWNRIRKNPGRFTHQPVAGGFRILNENGDPLLSVLTETFPNGYLTFLVARVFDEKGNLRITPLGKSIEVIGDAQLTLDGPFE